MCLSGCVFVCLSGSVLSVVIYTMILVSCYLCFFSSNFMPDITVVLVSVCVCVCVCVCEIVWCDVLEGPV